MPPLEVAGLRTLFPLRFSGRLHRDGGQRGVFVGLAEVIRRPFVREQRHWVFPNVVGDARAGGQRERVQGLLGDVRGQPADHRPGSGFEPGFRPVLALEPELHHLELERPHRRQQRRLDGRMPQVQRLDHAFLQQLLQPLPELLVLRRVGIVQVAERLRREPRAKMSAVKDYEAEGLAFIAAPGTSETARFCRQSQNKVA